MHKFYTTKVSFSVSYTGSTLSQEVEMLTQSVYFAYFAFKLQSCSSSTFFLLFEMRNCTLKQKWAQLCFKVELLTPYSLYSREGRDSETC